MIYTNKELTEKIEKFLTKTCMAATAFGTNAIRDPNIVFSIRNGRQCGEKIQAKIKNYIKNYNRRRA